MPFSSASYPCSPVSPPLSSSPCFFIHFSPFMEFLLLFTLLLLNHPYFLLSSLHFPSFLPPSSTSLLLPVTFIFPYVSLALLHTLLWLLPFHLSSLFPPVVSYSCIPSLPLFICLIHAPYCSSSILLSPLPLCSILLPPPYLLSFPFLFLLSLLPLFFKFQLLSSLLLPLSFLNFLFPHLPYGSLPSSPFLPISSVIFNYPTSLLFPSPKSYLQFSLSYTFVCSPSSLLSSPTTSQLFSSFQCHLPSLSLLVLPFS